MAEIRNPNQKGGDSASSMLIPMLVMVIAIGGMQYFRSKHTAPLQSPQAQQQQQNAPASASPVAPQAAVAPQATTLVAANTVAAAAEQTTVIENELYRIVFTNRGAAVQSWILKREKDRYGVPLDLVHSAAAREFGAPLSLYTYDNGLTQQLNAALFQFTPPASSQAPQTLEFHYVANGLDVTKSFSFGTDYMVHATYSVVRNGVPVRALLAWPGGFGDQDSMVDYNSSVFESMAQGDAKHLAYAKVSGGNTLNAPLDYAGVSDQFFTALFIPDKPTAATAVTLHQTIDVEKLKRTHPGQAAGVPTGKAIPVPIVGAAVGDTNNETSLRIYAGPKSYSILNGITTANGERLSPVVDFGFFGIVGKPLFFALHFLQEHGVSNWGWTIIVFTILINLVLLPLRVTSMKSALKMQRLQPQMDAIKARYAKYKVTDPKRAEMNQEIMTLQKDNGVNMFGGCIPTLIQLPLLIAMFSMLQKVVELRQAHWFWLHDLTAADPYHILPIIMIVSQFLVQFYMPSPGVDPQQQKMMAFMMPAFSGYMTWNYSAGLALYWCVGNLIMIVQQFVMNKSSLGQEMKAIAAKRARKKQGTIQGRR